jgi:hypothetical protein
VRLGVFAVVLAVGWRGDLPCAAAALYVIANLACLPWLRSSARGAGPVPAHQGLSSP